MKASQYLDYKFTLPPRNCRVAGRIEGVTGGNKDFEAIILDDENFRNWAAKLSARGIESGRKVVWSFDEAIAGPGDWHLVVSNMWSTFTAKAVTIDAKATCPAS